MARERMLQERCELLERREESIASFDGALDELCAEKSRLLSDVQRAELRRWVLHRELLLLREATAPRQFARHSRGRLARFPSNCARY